MKIMIWLLVVPALVWAVLRVGGWERGLLVQLLSFTTYAAALAWIPVIVALLGRHWIAGGVALIAALALAFCVVPRAIPGKSPAGGNRLQVMTSNMRYGSADPATIVGLVKDNDVDVLAVQEFTPEGRDALTRAGLDALLPYHSLAPEPAATGSGLYSRFPITDPGSRRNWGGFMQAHGTIQPPGSDPVTLVSAHPNAPYSVGALTSWARDLREEPRPDPSGPARILLGDFNATLDHAEMRALTTNAYRDAADLTGKGWVPTWGIYAGPRHLPPITIDHVLVDPRIGVRDVQVHRVPDTDHRAVIAWVTIPAAK